MIEKVHELLVSVLNKKDLLVLERSQRLFSRRPVRLNVEPCSQLNHIPMTKKCGHIDSMREKQANKVEDGYNTNKNVKAVNGREKHDKQLKICKIIMRISFQLRDS